jgi:hypothetical protein
MYEKPAAAAGGAGYSFFAASSWISSEVNDFGGASGSKGFGGQVTNGFPP